jgi:hypothetical protein
MANWKVSPLYKKSCEEHEHYIKDGLTIVRQTGFRGASFYVETSDDNPPEFEFDLVPGGDGSKDSIDMYNCEVNNIESVELDSMWDGCWEEIVYDDNLDEAIEYYLDQDSEESVDEEDNWDYDEDED